MKTLKRNIFIKSLLLILVVACLGSCKKDDDNDIGAGATGTFTVKGTKFSGPCQSIPATSGVSGNIDAIIASSTGASFIVYNIPTGSSGTSNVVEIDDNVPFSSQLYVICTVNSSTIYSSTGGTVTKTGSNSYTFSVNMIDLTTDETVTVTGSGKY
ncbi:hypothetical protein EWM62_13675 [Mucilaginibacter terrigena]|uniref:Lipocalin-like domain-containing protein n=1 Tax=Mucilaginibacter terrigena TaxID=2492395 RepID=A0A4Q5LJA6_9SPHI|nr:hypothetical protein [Mucilaginibacter terrigena]RYU89374.1 hypothetical protein EWM62_13675 [Mucilaginibacter terrigena]